MLLILIIRRVKQVLTEVSYIAFYMRSKSMIVWLPTTLREGFIMWALLPVSMFTILMLFLSFHVVAQSTGKERFLATFFPSQPKTPWVQSPHCFSFPILLLP